MTTKEHLKKYITLEDFNKAWEKSIPTITKVHEQINQERLKEFEKFFK